MSAIHPRGPAADPKFPISTDPSNPYGFTPQLLRAGALPPKITDKYVFFFGYEGEDPHICLSQWFPFPFQAKVRQGLNDEIIEFPTTEHYMMFQKANCMADDEIAQQILHEPHPSVAKRLGREVKNFDREKWNSIADQVVEDANWYKFNSDPELTNLLLSTGDKMLVEARYVKTTSIGTNFFLTSYQSR